MVSNIVVLQKYKVGNDLGNPNLHVTWYLE